MVVFTCNNCGESLQKPKVAKHYQFQCRSAENLTCVDCHKDFYGQEYVAHTKCITESERYGGTDYVARPGQNKGERKQQEWINVVKNVFDTAANLSHDERHILNILSKYDNIPRKKAKFLNFIKNIMGPRVNMTVIDSVWTKMETAFKGSVPQNTQTQNINGKESENPVTNNSSPAKNHENYTAENENNENIVRENGCTAISPIEIAENGGNKKKKSKKRDTTVLDAVDEAEPVTKKKKKNEPNEEIVEDAATVVLEDNQELAKFDWKATILEIVGSREEIAVKKLRKKVVNRYLNHCGNSVTNEKAGLRFDKKLRKTSELIVNDDKVMDGIAECERDSAIGARSGARENLDKRSSIALKLIGLEGF